MEPIQLLPFNFFTLLLFVSFTFLLIKGLMKSKRTKKNKNLPPSPWKLPLIGNMHHLVGASPHRALRELSKKYGPVVYLQLGEIPTIVISSREAAKNALKVNDPACAGRPESIGSRIIWYNHTDIAFCSYSNYWRQIRKLCIVELFSTKNVRSSSSIREEEAAHLLKTIESSCGKPLDITKEIFSFTSTVTCKAAFGEVLKDKDTLIRLLKEALTFAGGFTLADFFPSFKLLQFIMSWHKNRLWKMRAKLDAILDSLINEHRDNKAKNKRGNGVFGDEDIVDVLIRLQGSGQLDISITNDNIKAIIFDLFAGGTETSATTVDWAMVEMMRNPHVMAKAQAEIRGTFKNGTLKESHIRTLKYLKLIIKETLRLHPPAPLLPRACREECEVNGYIIPFKAKVLVNSWALGRDSNYWPDAESFKPERFENNSVDFFGNNFEFLPFGAGKRICPGLNFGLASVESLLAQLLYRFDWKLPEAMKPSEVDISEAEGLSVPRKNHPYLIPTPYNS